MQIDSVSYKKKKVRIEFRNEFQYGGSTYKDPMARESFITPTPEFFSALDKMASLVAGFGVDNRDVLYTEVHKVDIGREKDNLTVVLHVIQGTKKTSAPFEFKTPKVSELEPAWTGEVTDAVLELMIQAEKYVNSEYAQTELEFEGEEKPDTGEVMTLVSQDKTEEAVAA